jgi:hypothetical protein
VEEGAAKAAGIAIGAARVTEPVPDEFESVAAGPDPELEPEFDEGPALAGVAVADAEVRGLAASLAAAGTGRADAGAREVKVAGDADTGAAEDVDVGRG